jgi:hypothetical protein
VAAASGGCRGGHRQCADCVVPPFEHAGRPGLPAPCPDFSLLSEELSVGKGYSIAIGTKEIPDIVTLVFNVMGCMSSAAGTLVRLDYASQTAKRLEKKRKLLELSGERGASDEESGAASPQ